VSYARLSAALLSLSLPHRYFLFAVTAGSANLLTQAIVFRISTIEPLPISILIGTIVGFFLKYILDKNWIFFDGYIGARRELQKVLLYGAFSVLMTLLFWGFEIAFWKVGGSELAKYLGAAVGLAIGNVAKYLLDRSFTFAGRAEIWK
jgi:putative flippase GtrA